MNVPVRTFAPRPRHLAELLVALWLGLAVSMPAGASEDAPWRLPLRSGAHARYECTSSNQPASTFTAMVVTGEVDGGATIAFSFGDNAADVEVVVDTGGRPVRLLDPAAAVESWRESALQKIGAAAKPSDDEQLDVAPNSAGQGLERGIRYAEEPDDIASYALARASVFLPPTITSREGDALEVVVPIEHPFYAGGGIGTGQMGVARRWPGGMEATMTLFASAADFQRLTMKMVAMANGPDVDLRSAWLFLGFIDVRETRLVSVPARRSWASEIHREIVRASPFGSASETRTCVRRR